MAAEVSARAAGSSRRTLVYLVRHGQTPLNESDVLRGLADPPLDETGHRQAQCLGTALGTRRLSSVVASPLLRAQPDRTAGRRTGPGGSYRPIGACSTGTTGRGQAPAANRLSAGGARSTTLRVF